MKKAAKGGAPVEVQALGTVLAALQRLDDKQRGWVIASAVTNLNIPASTAFNPVVAGAGAGVGAAGAAGGANVAAASLPGQPGSREHARAFMRQKAPQSDVQRVACLAYYLDKFKGTAVFRGKEINDVNVDAAGPKFNVTRAVDNATRRSHYLAVASGTKKQITGLGEDVVGALPDQQKVTEVEAAGLPRRAKAKRKKKKV